MSRADGVPAEPTRTLRTPSDISDARARWAAGVAVLARRLGVPVDHARAMAIELSIQRGVTVDAAIDALDRNELWKYCGVDESPASGEQDG
jgi:hypothetical protein